MNDLQRVILDVFKEIRILLDRNGLRYFAIGGTAIGAVRHKGYIPWDDDLDIAMPVEDYRAFLEIAPNDLPEYFEVIKPYKNPYYESVFSKVVDCRTTVIQRPHINIPYRYTGAWVDVMPMSGVPDDGFARSLMIKRLKAILTLQQICVDRDPHCSTRHRLFRGMMMPLRPIAHHGFFQDMYYRVLNNHPFDSADYCGYTWAHELKDLIFPKEWFSDTVDFPFEDTTISLPVGWDEYLKCQFGDYMTLPDVDDRITHECYVDLDHSFKDYASGILDINVNLHDFR